MFVDFTVHRIVALIKSIDRGDEKCIDPIEVRYRLSRWLDTYWVIVTDVLQTSTMDDTDDDAAAKYTAVWWEKMCRYCISIPGEEQLNVHAAHAIMQRCDKYIRSHQKMETAEVNRYPFASIVFRSLPHKHNLKSYQERFREVVSIVQKRKTSKGVNGYSVSVGVTVLRCVLQWWILFMIGGYRHAKPVLSAKTRLEAFELWNQLEGLSLAPSHYDEWLQNQIQPLANQTLLLLFAVKEYTFYTFRDHPGFYHTLRELSEGNAWGRYETECINVIDAYRQSGDTLGLTDYIKKMNDLGLRIRMPVDYWPMMLRLFRYEPIPLGTAMQDQICKSMIEALYQQHLIGRYRLFPPNEIKDFQYSGVRLSCVRPWCIQRRIIIMISAFFGISDDVIDVIIQTVSTFYQSPHRDSVLQEIIDSLHSISPIGYGVFYYMAQAWKSWNDVWVAPLSVQWSRCQLIQYQKRFQPREPNPRAMWFVYCPNCGDIQTLVNQSRSKGSSCPKKYDASKVSGFENVAVDLDTGRWYCARNTGKKAETCSTTLQVYFSTCGRLVVFHDRVLVMCPYCGIHTELNSENDEWDTDGVMCSKCIEHAFRWEQNDVKAWNAEELLRNAGDSKKSIRPYPDPRFTLIRSDDMYKRTRKRGRPIGSKTNPEKKKERNLMKERRLQAKRMKHMDEREKAQTIENDDDDNDS